MSAPKKYKTRCVAVRSGRNAQFVGHMRKNTELWDLSSVAMEKIFMELCADDIAKMFILHPKFAQAAANAFEIVCRNNVDMKFQVKLSSTRDAKSLKNIRKILEHLGSYVLKLKIVGYCNYEVTADDIQLIQDIVGYCPNVTTLIFYRIYTDDLGMEYLMRFKNLTAVNFAFSRLGRETIHLPNVVDFATSILPLPDCRTCDEALTIMRRPHELITHDDFIQLWRKNPQLQRVKLYLLGYLIRLEPCLKNYDLRESYFFSEVDRMVLSRNMESFKFISDTGYCQLANNRIYLMNMNPPTYKQF